MAGEGSAPPEGLDEFVAQAPANPAPSGAAPSTPPGLDEFVAPEMQQAQYGTPTEIAKTALEGLGKGLAGPAFTGAETALLGNEKEQLARAEANPITHYGTEAAGLVGGALLAPEVTLGGNLAKAGEAIGAGAEALGIGKLGSSVAKSAIENLIYQGQDEVSKLIQKDPAQSSDTAIADMGLAALIGGSFGTVSPLWHATMGKQTGGILGAIADKLGGIEGVESNAADKLIAKSGMDIAPELRGLVSENPGVQQMARELSQTDTNASGLEFQKSYKAMTKQAGDLMIEALGKTPEEIATMPPVSKYEAGKAIGNSLADEYDSQLQPYSKVFEELKNKFKNTDLVQELNTEPKTFSTVDEIANKISQKAIDEGWAASPSSDIMKEVERVVKELPLQKNLKNLGDFITQVGNNTNKDFTNGPLRRAGAIMSGVMRDAEGDVIALRLGEKDGPAAVEAFKAAREGYAVQSALKEDLDSRLGLHGSTSGYSKALREMARTDGESILRRMSGKGDAQLLDFMTKHYPQTAEVIRNYHVNDLLSNAASKAKEGATIDNTTLLRNVAKMSPELRDFVSNKDSQNNIMAIAAALDAFKNPNHNFSNTARTMAGLVKDLPGTVVGAATALTGHGFVKSALAVPLVKAIGKDVPDAIRLGLLRFLGSDKHVEAGAFKTMVDYLHHTAKGETLLSNATKAIFKTGSEVLPESQFPTEKDRDKIKKTIDSSTDDPNKLLNITGKLGHYMPDHTVAMNQTAANAVQYLSNQKPNTAKLSPLDTQRESTKLEKAQYNRKIDIAQQPLMILKHIADGRLTPDDVVTQRSLYPALYDRTVQKLNDQVVKAKSEGKTIPYRTRMSLSLYMGQSVDSTMLPSNIMAAQPKAPMQQPQTATEPASNPKRSTTSLSKMSSMYKTQAQAAEQDRNGRPSR